MPANFEIADRRWHTQPTATSPPSAPASLTISNQLVTNNYQTRILDAYSSIAVRKYLLSRQPSWTESVMDSVDWYHLGIALTTIFKKSKNRFLTFREIYEQHVQHRRPEKRFTDKSKTAVTTSFLQHRHLSEVVTAVFDLSVNRFFLRLCWTCCS